MKMFLSFLLFSSFLFSTRLSLKCFEKDTRPVDTDDLFRGCGSVRICTATDITRVTSYLPAVSASCKSPYLILTLSFSFLLSYTCVSVDDYYWENFYHWNVSVSDRCCENCDGVVYKADSVIDTTYLEDKCQTIETRTCRILPGIKLPSLGSYWSQKYSRWEIQFLFQTF